MFSAQQRKPQSFRSPCKCAPHSAPIPYSCWHPPARFTARAPLLTSSHLTSHHAHLSSPHLTSPHLSLIITSPHTSLIITSPHTSLIITSPRTSLIITSPTSAPTGSFLLGRVGDLEGPATRPRCGDPAVVAERPLRRGV
eukprot:gene13507-biopygen3968